MGSFTLSKMSSQTKNIIFIIIILVAATIYYMVSGSNAVVLTIGEKSFTLSGPEEVEVIDLSFDDIIEMELIDSAMDFGEAKELVENGNYVFATYENEEWGEYKAYYDKKLECYIAVHTADSVTVFNFESEDTTIEFHRSFSEFLSDPTNWQ